MAILKNFCAEIEILSEVLFTTVSETVTQEYFKHLSHISDEDFKIVCDKLKVEWKQTSYQRFPAIGVFHETYRGIVSDRSYQQQPEPETTNTDCVSAYFAVLLEIKEWHDAKLVKYQHPSCKPMTLEAWHDAGRPKSWSPMLDNFMVGLYVNRLDTYASFCREYLDTLRESRAKRQGRVAA